MYALKFGLPVSKRIYGYSQNCVTPFDFSLIGFLLYYVGLPGVLWVLPDSYLDVPNKDYGGLFAGNLGFCAILILLSLVACLLTHHLFTVSTH